MVQQISSLMRLCGLGNQFGDDSILQRISPLTSLCFIGLGNQFGDDSMLQRISPLTSLCFIELVL